MFVPFLKELYAETTLHLFESWRMLDYLIIILIINHAYCKVNRPILLFSLQLSSTIHENFLIYHAFF